MVSPIDPTGTGFLLAENRSMPMHVGGLQLFEKPEGAGRNYGREMYESMRNVDEIAPLFLKRPHRSLATAGQLVWVEDEQFDIDHHIRHSALPKPGRIRELLDLSGRLHARVRADGTLSAANALGEHRGSIHQVGAAVQGAPACNGWTFWHFEQKGARLPIDHLRQQVRAGL